MRPLHGPTGGSLITDVRWRTDEPMSLRSRFEEFCKAAYEGDFRGSGSVSDFESYLIQLVEFCKGELPESRSQIVDCFVAVGRGDISAPEETLPFCMHALRFVEVRETLKDYIESLDEETPRLWDLKHFLAKVEASYDDVWEDRDMWAYYDGRGHNTEPRPPAQPSSAGASEGR